MTKTNLINNKRFAYLHTLVDNTFKSICEKSNNGDETEKNREEGKRKFWKVLREKENDAIASIRVHYKFKTSKSKLVWRMRCANFE